MLRRTIFILAVIVIASTAYAQKPSVPLASISAFTCQVDNPNSGDVTTLKCPPVESANMESPFFDVPLAEFRFNGCKTVDLEVDANGHIQIADKQAEGCYVQRAPVCKGGDLADGYSRPPLGSGKWGAMPCIKYRLGSRREPEKKFAHAQQPKTTPAIAAPIKMPAEYSTQLLERIQAAKKLETDNAQLIAAWRAYVTQQKEFQSQIDMVVMRAAVAAKLTIEQLDASDLVPDGKGEFQWVPKPKAETAKVPKGN